MHPTVKMLRGLGELGQLLEPNPPATKPGVEHVMVEIAPGVFKSIHRQPRPSSGARLLRELEQARSVHDHVKSKFAELSKGVRDRRRSQR